MGRCRKTKKTAAWEGHDFPQLLKDVYDYTYDVMSDLKKAGIRPEWVQVGNETPGGMTYPEGSVKNWLQFAQLINNWYDAIIAVSPRSKVILHLDQGNNSERFRTWFDNAKAHGAKYDVIGFVLLSLMASRKPDYSLSIDDLGKNMNDRVARLWQRSDGSLGMRRVHQTTKQLRHAGCCDTESKSRSGWKRIGAIYWEPQGARS